ncbi:MAG: thiamine pyrophosphate-binding protein [Candidatus Lokiarchaeota archaeon]|nr:thiamine pyrophosphate-binding protein [Candidatus Lokiarchaeota archaeon]
MNLTGGEIIVKYLIKENVPYVFGIPGHGCLGLLDAFIGQNKIKIIQMKQEMSGVHMAEGYYRVSGQPCAAFTSIGPGALNTAIGLGNAYADSIPVLVITGDTHVHMRGVGVLQEIERNHDSNVPRVLEPLVKRSFNVAKVSQLPRVMERAFNLMMKGRKGPVHINLPMDVQSDSTEVEDFPRSYKYKPQAKMYGDPKAIKEASDLLIEAKRPTILVGGGVIQSEAFNELKEIAELIGAAVVTTMMGKGAFPEDHPLYGWHTGSKGTKIGLNLTSKADVLLAVGTRFADETASSYKKGVSFSIPPTKLIHIDIDPYEIGKNYKVAVGIMGDSKAVLHQIINEIKKRGYNKEYENTEYFKKIQNLQKEWTETLENWRDYEKSPVMISVLIKELRDFFDKDTIFITSSGNIQAQALQELMVYKPKTHITTGGFSTMGFTLPATIGAKLAAPENQVVGLIGDGDFMMTIQELSTAVQLDIPVIEIIVNNMGWIAIKDLQMAVFGEDRAKATDFYDSSNEIYSPDFKKIAEGFGCYSERISESHEIKGALERAVNSNKPSVIEVLVNREYPYSGSPAHGWWDVPVPSYLEGRREKYEEEKKGEQI